MSLSSLEAAKSLSQVAQTERRSTIVYGYRQSSVHFFIWAAVWAAGYSATYLVPTNAPRIWLIVVSLGMAASFLAGVKAGPSLTRPNGLRMLGAAAVTQAFMASVMIVIHGQGWEMGVLWPLLLGAIYAAVGLWAGLRYAATGVTLMGLTLVGYFYLPQYFCLWMAVVGPGALLLGGIWLRRV